MVAVADQKRAYLCGLAAVLLWSTVASAFKITLRYMDYAELLFWASCASTGALGVLVVAQGKVGQVLRSRPTDYARSLTLGALNPLLYYLILFKAYQLLPAQEAQALNYTWALTLTWLSIPLLGQRIGRRDLAAGLICYAGVLVISTRGEIWTLRFSDPLGVALALSSTVVWAFYWIYNTRDERDPVVRLFLNFALSLPLALGCVLLMGQWRAPAWPGLLGAAVHRPLRNGDYICPVAVGAALRGKHRQGRQPNLYLPVLLPSADSLRAGRVDSLGDPSGTCAHRRRPALPAKGKRCGQDVTIFLVVCRKITIILI